MMIQYMFSFNISGNHKKLNELKLRSNVSVLEFFASNLIKSDRGFKKEKKNANKTNAKSTTFY